MQPINNLVKRMGSTDLDHFSGKGDYKSEDLETEILTNAFEEMIEAYDYLLKPISPNKMEELFGRIRTELISRLSTKQGNEGNLKDEVIKSGYEELVEKIEKYVENNIIGDNSIPAICKRFNISQPYLSKIFRKAKKCTFNEFVILVKVREAKKLLISRQDLLIRDIAIQLGFSDQFYFSKVFKNIEGCTPTEYRSKQINQQINQQINPNDN